MKVKVFRFTVSNAASAPMTGDETKDWYQKRKKELVTEKSIEKALNKFMETVKVVEVKVNTVDVDYHNNGRGNTVDMVYTILYEEL